jgi:hypothetical protein
VRGCSAAFLVQEVLYYQESLRNIQSRAPETTEHCTRTGPNTRHAAFDTDSSNFPHPTTNDQNTTAALGDRACEWIESLFHYLFGFHLEITRYAFLAKGMSTGCDLCGFFGCNRIKANGKWHMSYHYNSYNYMHYYYMTYPYMHYPNRYYSYMHCPTYLTITYHAITCI